MGGCKRENNKLVASDGLPGVDRLDGDSCGPWMEVRFFIYGLVSLSSMVIVRANY